MKGLFLFSVTVPSTFLNRCPKTQLVTQSTDGVLTSSAAQETECSCDEMRTMLTAKVGCHGESE